ncbi:type IV secretion system DNA-binding domain-containing protein [Candidatus Aquarickettsia rohweri]|uniref:type IV secretion system DNA-binding domain-containing protein n=1 Tax=Candidatus Aquarickettsia rohweri TaxID=2602574 RepID=UPI00138FB50F|nr:type IV secretion system DNA-binding domain-containing protein [Candidatus Aquarickettsia rohweri]
MFLASKAEAKRDLNPLITAQMDIAINAMRSLSEGSNKPKIWFIIDELGYFDNPIPNLIDGLTTARSYGGCFVLGM